VFFTTKALSYNIWAIKVSRQAFRSRWSLVVGRWSLVVGRWSLVVGRWSLVVGRWSLVVGRWSAHLAIRTRGAADKYLT
jgi:uncharacterized protein YutD